MQNVQTPCAACGKGLVIDVTMCLLCGEVVPSWCCEAHKTAKHPVCCCLALIPSGTLLLLLPRAKPQFIQLDRNKFGLPFTIGTMDQTRSVLDVSAFESLRHRLFTNELLVSPNVASQAAHHLRAVFGFDDDSDSFDVGFDSKTSLV